MKRTSLIYYIAATALMCLSVVISCKKDNNGAVITKSRLTGLVQKGPFTEASVSIYELNSSLERTGKVLNGQVFNQTGSFKIDNVSLSSQYAELKANGYYFNEVSGDISPYHLSLSAISDIKDLSSVNINLLTTLEKERVKYLVGRGHKFSDAKDTAQSEVLSIFGFTFVTKVVSEKLDISIDNEENAKLLAISVLLQGNRSPRELSEFIDTLSSDIREVGRINDISIFQRLRNASVTLDLGKTRNNLENQYQALGNSGSIPDFEKYVSTFFLHSALPPSVITSKAINVTEAEATFTGFVNCNDLGSTVHYEYGTTTSYGHTIDTVALSGRTLKEVSCNVSGLNPGTLYHYRLMAEYRDGIIYGNDSTFITKGKAPSANTQSATSIFTDGAILNGSVNANGLKTSVSFEIGPTNTYGSEVSATPGEAFGESVIKVSSVITGLTIGSVYHYRIKTINPLGTVFGDDIVFKTLGKVPSSITYAANNIAGDKATLNGVVNANDLNTAVTFEYGISDAYGNSGQAAPVIVTGHLNTNVSYNITGLSPNTLYHFRVVSTNSLGTVYGSDQIFTTVGNSPVVVILAASEITSESAMLNASVNAHDLNTEVSFDLGPTESYGTKVIPFPNVVSGNSDTGVGCIASGLTFNTVYHYRVKAVNLLGTAFSSDRTFKTIGDLPLIASSYASTIRETSVTLNGVVNANLFSSEVIFEYGESTSYGNSVASNPGYVGGSTNTKVSAVVIGLKSEVQYHFRIKAVNSLGTSYGNDVSFKTAPGVVYDVDGNAYSSVVIGNQTWMTENIKTTKFNDNTPIPILADNSGWAGMKTPAYCWYNNNETLYKNVYGGIYNWYVLDSLSNGGKNVCPTGWHPPSGSEWGELIKYVGGEGSGYKLMETGVSHWPSPNSSATDETGFKGLPGGVRDEWGAYSRVGYFGFFLCTHSPLENSVYTILFELTEYGYAVSDVGIVRAGGASVRCLRDK